MAPALAELVGQGVTSEVDAWTETVVRLFAPRFEVLAAASTYGPVPSVPQAHRVLPVTNPRPLRAERQPARTRGRQTRLAKCEGRRQAADPAAHDENTHRTLPFARSTAAAKAVDASNRMPVHG
jgi:hypothetical protein